MKNRLKKTLVLLLCISVLAGCGKQGETSIDESVQPVSDTSNIRVSIENEVNSFALEDGVYSVDFDTDSSMFHVNESCEGKAKLTVEEGKAVLHLVMPSKNVLNLYLGLAEDAKKEGAELLEPSTEAVTYSDGYEEEVFSYDVPITVYDEEFDLAIIGKKEIWYDHKVKISNAKPWSDPISDAEIENISLEEGTYQVPVTLEGGTGKAKLESPTKLVKTSDGYLVTLIWSSKYYDYMIVDEIKYFPVDSNEHSVFEIPVSDISISLNVIADTIAMSTPHEIEYTITFDCDAIQ